MHLTEDCSVCFPKLDQPLKLGVYCLGDACLLSRQRHQNVPYAVGVGLATICRAGGGGCPPSGSVVPGTGCAGLVATGIGSGFQPAMILTNCCAFSLSVISGNMRRNSIPALNAPSRSKTARIAAASASLIENIQREWPGITGRASPDWRRATPIRSRGVGDPR